MFESFAIKTRGLTRRFGTHVAVDAVGVRVPPGSVYGFLGPNGAGKSTTIRLLLGLLRPDGGSIALLGQPFVREGARRATNRERLLQRVGALVEAPSVYDHLTGRENLTVTAQLRGERSSAPIDRALDIVGLSGTAGKRAGDYSLGMKQRLGLALALLGDPDLLVLDEPTNGLDPAGMQDVRTLIGDLPERAGVTVFLSSHLLGEVERVASHVGVIREGRLVFQGPTTELRAQQAPRLVLRVRKPDAACAVLNDAPPDCIHDALRVARDGENRLVVRPGTDAVAARCVSRLVQAGHDVYHVRVQEPSLEDVFLALTGASESLTAAPIDPPHGTTSA
jgi:ABC-2 type transport system ATP-binding protein